MLPLALMDARVTSSVMALAQSISNATRAKTVAAVCCAENVLVHSSYETGVFDDLFDWQLARRWTPLHGWKEGSGEISRSRKADNRLETAHGMRACAPLLLLVLSRVLQDLFSRRDRAR